MEKKQNIQGFHFNFKSGNASLDEIWSESWEEFSDTSTVPLVGDVINFWYVFSEMENEGVENNGEIFEKFLKAYKTALFRVIKRTYCPYSNSDNKGNKIGVWCLYYLTIEPVEDDDFEFHLQRAKLLRSS